MIDFILELDYAFSILLNWHPSQKKTSSNGRTHNLNNNNGNKPNIDLTRSHSNSQLVSLVFLNRSRGFPVFSCTLLNV